MLIWIQRACTLKDQIPSLSTWAPERSLTQRIAVLATIGPDLLLPWACTRHSPDPATLTLVANSVVAADQASTQCRSGSTEPLQNERRAATKALLSSIASQDPRPLEQLPIPPLTAPAPVLDEWLCCRPWLATPGLVATATLRELSRRTNDLTQAVAFHLLIRQDFHAAAMARWIGIIQPTEEQMLFQDVLSELGSRCGLGNELDDELAAQVGLIHGLLQASPESGYGQGT